MATKVDQKTEKSQLTALLSRAELRRYRGVLLSHDMLLQERVTWLIREDMRSLQSEKESGPER